MTAIVIKAVAVALRDFPMINASFDAAADEIIYKDFVNIGVAVDTPRGLVVPVLRDANRKSLPEIAGELQTIGNNARAAKFEIADLRGATFSVTNYGAVGGIFGTPMVNTPESAILGLGRARMQPMVHGDQIVPRLILPLSLSFDHRIVDGADAARFTNEIMQSLENPLRMISLG
jgi:pyruvate dehydrogenase E2 component (dihydrolipoamide acetyltransferase)